MQSLCGINSDTVESLTQTWLVLQRAPIGPSALVHVKWLRRGFLRRRLTHSRRVGFTGHSLV